MTNVAEDVDKREWNCQWKWKWYSHYGEQYGGFKKVK